jgi:hypothetical protein
LGITIRIDLHSDLREHEIITSKRKQYAMIDTDAIEKNYRLLTAKTV